MTNTNTDSRDLADRIARLPEEDATPDELEAIEEGCADFREGRHMTLDQMRGHLRCLQ